MLFWFFRRVSSPDPPQPYQGFEKHLGNAGGPSGLRSGLRSALRLTPPSATALGPGSVPSGFFKSPLGLVGFGQRSPRKNQNSLYLFPYDKC